MARSKLNKLGLDNTMLNSKKNKLYEDTTEYGEFISTFDYWITLEEQKRNADYLANLENMEQDKRIEERFRGE